VADSCEVSGLGRISKPEIDVLMVFTSSPRNSRPVGPDGMCWECPPPGPATLAGPRFPGSPQPRPIANPRVHAPLSGCRAPFGVPRPFRGAAPLWGRATGGVASLNLRLISPTPIGVDVPRLRRLARRMTDWFLDESDNRRGGKYRRMVSNRPSTRDDTKPQ